MSRMNKPAEARGRGDREESDRPSSRPRAPAARGRPPVPFPNVAELNLPPIYDPSVIVPPGPNVGGQYNEGFLVRGVNAMYEFGQYLPDQQQYYPNRVANLAPGQGPYPVSFQGQVDMQQPGGPLYYPQQARRSQPVTYEMLMNSFQQGAEAEFQLPTINANMQQQDVRPGAFHQMAAARGRPQQALAPPTGRTRAAVNQRQNVPLAATSQSTGTGGGGRQRGRPRGRVNQPRAAGAGPNRLNQAAQPQKQEKSIAFNAPAEPTKPTGEFSEITLSDSDKSGSDESTAGGNSPEQEPSSSSGGEADAIKSIFDGVAQLFGGNAGMGAQVAVPEGKSAEEIVALAKPTGLFTVSGVDSNFVTQIEGCESKAPEYKAVLQHWEEGNKQPRFQPCEAEEVAVAPDVIEKGTGITAGNEALAAEGQGPSPSEDCMTEQEDDASPSVVMSATAEQDVEASPSVKMSATAEQDVEASPAMKITDIAEQEVVASSSMETASIAEKKVEASPSKGTLAITKPFVGLVPYDPDSESEDEEDTLIGSLQRATGGGGPPISPFKENQCQMSACVSPDYQEKENYSEPMQEGAELEPAVEDALTQELEEGPTQDFEPEPTLTLPTFAVQESATAHSSHTVRTVADRHTSTERTDQERAKAVQTILNRTRNRRIEGKCTYAQFMDLAHYQANIDFTKLSSVQESHIMVIGRPEATELLKQKLKTWLPEDNIVQCTPAEMPFWLLKHQNDGSASKFKHFIYMGVIDEESDEYKNKIVNDFFTIKEYVDDLDRVDLFLCRAYGTNANVSVPPPDYFYKVHGNQKLWRPFLYDVPVQVDMQLEYCRTRFINLATGQYKWINEQS